jgi:hypothetical protein
MIKLSVEAQREMDCGWKLALEAERIKVASDDPGPSLACLWAALVNWPSDRPTSELVHLLEGMAELVRNGTVTFRIREIASHIETIQREQAALASRLPFVNRSGEVMK